MSGPMNWLLRQRTLRIALIALTFPLPLLAVVSAALVVMVAALQGWRQALEDCAAALLVLIGLTMVAGGYWVEIGIGAWMTWMGALLLGHLRRIGSLTLALQAAVLLGMAGVIGFVLWSREPVAFWEQVLGDLAERARSAGLDVETADLGLGLVPLMTGIMAASAVISSLTAVFLGCWWIGDNDGRRFASEFQALRMGRAMGGMTAVLLLLFFVGLGSIADDLLLVLGAGFLVQGLAVVHWHGARRQWPAAWPFALYLPLILVPVVAVPQMLLLALLGLVDNGYSLRRLESKVT